jgi:hypothetical protein
MVSDEVLQDPRYQEWMNRFKEGAKHVICADRYAERQTFRVDSAILRNTLNRLDNDIFPLSVNPECVGGDEQLLKRMSSI